MFYHYDQNNSYGRFDFTKDVGHHVFIEVDNGDQANEIAESKGIYFDGEDDCPCCGYRWHRVYSDDPGLERPQIYGEEVGAGQPTRNNDWAQDDDEYEVVVHYKNGEVDRYRIADGTYVLVDSDVLS